jgi:hypothetical protein
LGNEIEKKRKRNTMKYKTKFIKYKIYPCW